MIKSMKEDLVVLRLDSGRWHVVEGRLANGEFRIVGSKEGVRKGFGKSRKSQLVDNRSD